MREDARMVAEKDPQKVQEPAGTAYRDMAADAAEFQVCSPLHCLSCMQRIAVCTGQSRACFRGEDCGAIQPHQCYSNMVCFPTVAAANAAHVVCLLIGTS